MPKSQHQSCKHKDNEPQSRKHNEHKSRPNPNLKSKRTRKEVLTAPNVQLNTGSKVHIEESKRDLRPRIDGKVGKKQRLIKYIIIDDDLTKEVSRPLIRKTPHLDALISEVMFASIPKMPTLHNYEKRVWPPKMRFQ